MKDLDARFPNYSENMLRPDLTHAGVSRHDAVAAIAADGGQDLGLSFSDDYRASSHFLRSFYLVYTQMLQAGSCYFRMSRIKMTGMILPTKIIIDPVFPEIDGQLTARNFRWRYA